jgi:hypothetical protein
MGMKSKASRSYLHRLEKGKLRNLQFMTVIRYLQACKAPVGKFLLELAQSGAFGEAEQGLSTDYADYTDGARNKTAREAKAKVRYEQRAAREARDAELVAELWRAVQVAIAPMLRQDPTSRLVPYLEGVRAFYRAWKLANRSAGGRDPTPVVRAAFDRVEQAGLEARLIPAAVRRMREVVFERLRRTAGQRNSNPALRPRNP